MLTLTSLTHIYILIGYSLSALYCKTFTEPLVPCTTLGRYAASGLALGETSDLFTVMMRCQMAQKVQNMVSLLETFVLAFSRVDNSDCNILDSSRCILVYLGLKSVNYRLVGPETDTRG